MATPLPQPPVEPFLRLAQANVESLSEFWLSPDVMQQPLALVKRLFQPDAEPASAAPSVSSEAFARLLKALAENYTRFLSDLSQGGMVWWNEATRAVQEASDDVVDATEVVRRPRAAA
jgi:hypothetical protein